VRILKQSFVNVEVTLKSFESGVDNPLELSYFQVKFNTVIEILAHDCYTERNIPRE
jgi:hypothetical protein